VVGARYGSHHGVGSNDDQAVDPVQPDFRLIEIPAPLGGDGFGDVSHERFIPPAPRREARRPIAAPYDHVTTTSAPSRSLLLCSGRWSFIYGKMLGSRSAAAQFTPDRKQNCVAKSAADQQYGFGKRRFRRCARGARENHRFSGIQQLA
jgi:hypothetical protein